MPSDEDLPLPEIEVSWEQTSAPSAEETTSLGEGKPMRLVWLGIGVAVLLVFVWLAVLDGEPDEPNEPGASPEVADVREAGENRLPQQDQLDAVLLTRSIPEELIAAELFHAAPGADTLRDLLGAIGELDGIVIGTAEGAFDMVTFDPSDSSRLLASRRSGYGNAQNQHVTEEWVIENGKVQQSLFAPDTLHDFTHFNSDGTFTVWAHSGGPAGFAPRTATLVDNSGAATVFSPIYASRFAVTDRTLFTLTGSEDYYSPDLRYMDFVADDGVEVTRLGSGEPWAWIDSPMPGVVLAYPVDPTGVTGVWDTSTLERLEHHPLSGNSYQRVAASGDGSTGIGVTFDGTMEVFDPRTGDRLEVFGQLDPTAITQSVTLNADGTIAVTVDRSGTVTMWWVGDEKPILVVDADAGPARVVSERRAARASSTVTNDASRVALRGAASPEAPVTWTIVDTRPQSWIDRACELVGRQLTAAERAALGLGDRPSACT